MESIQQNSTILSPALASPTPTVVSRPASTRALKRLSNYRLALGWLILAFWFPSMAALDWDADWHFRVGRDGFWTPPHWAFYSTVTVAGVICLGVVLLETLLYYRRYPGFNDQTTTPVLWFFRGPIGFILAGFGMLVMIVSAPLDDYWHRIFGIDLKIWTQFHVMLLIGILMANLGIIYLFASELNRRRAWAKPVAGSSPAARILANLRELARPATLGFTLALVAFGARFIFLMAETSTGTLEFNGAKLPSYSLTLMAFPVLLVVAAFATRRVGVATLTGLLFLLFRLLDVAFIDWGVKALAPNGTRPGILDIQYITPAYPLFLPLAGLLVDAIFLATIRWRSRAKTVYPALFSAMAAGLASGLVLFLLEKPWEAYNNAMTVAAAASNNAMYSVMAAGRAFRPAYWQALPLVLILAAAGGAFALAVATSLRYTDR